MSQTKHPAKGEPEGAAAIEELGKEAVATAQACFEHGRSQARQWEKNFEGAVRARPLTSMLIAGAVGLVAGVLWQCRRPRD